MKKYLPFILAAIFAMFTSSLAIAFISLANGNDGHRHTFSPLVIRPIVVPETLTIGEQALITNGLCNTSDRDISANVILKAQNVENTTVRVRLLPPQNAGEEHIIIFVPAGQCLGEVLFDDIVPGIIAPGLWILGINATVHGPEGEIQVAERTSNFFRVTVP